MVLGIVFAISTLPLIFVEVPNGVASPDVAAPLQWALLAVALLCVVMIARGWFAKLSGVEIAFYWLITGLASAMGLILTFYALNVTWHGEG